MTEEQIREEQIRAATERLLQANAYNEQLLKSLTVEEKHRQFFNLISKLDGSQGERLQTENANIEK